MRRVAPTLPLSKVMQTRLSFGQNPKVCPMKLSKSAGSLMVSSFIVLFLCTGVVSFGLCAVLIGDLCADRELKRH